MPRPRGPEKTHFQCYLTRTTMLRLRAYAEREKKPLSGCVEAAIVSWLDHVRAPLDYPVIPELENRAAAEAAAKGKEPEIDPERLSIEQFIVEEMGVEQLRDPKRQEYWRERLKAEAQADDNPQPGDAA